MDTGLYSTVFLIGSILIWKTSAQLGFNGCPLGWVHSESRCYKFESSSKLLFEEADSVCWERGARLLAINTYSEHIFITDWLKENDVVLLSTWFTAGYYANNMLLWETNDVTDIDDVNLLWNAPPSSTSRIYNRVAYKYGNGQYGYGWILVSASEPANYICEISVNDVRLMDFVDRDYDYGIGWVDKDSLPHGPSMSSEPKNVVVLGQGNDIYLECVAKAIPSARYTWTRGNTIITMTTSTRYTLSGGRLTIQNPDQVVDSGVYQCKAENTIGTILASPSTVTFGYLHSFSPVRPDDQVGTLFEGVRVSCYTPAYNPEVRYGWFKNHNTHNYIFPGHPVHFISQSGYLYFSEVQPTDDRTYYCVVTLVAPYNHNVDTTLPPSRVGLGTKLILRPGKTDGNYGPIIHTHSFPTPAVKGSLVRLECIAYGSLPLTYSWHRENGVAFVQGTQISDRNRVLTIPNAPLEAEGNYICTVSRRGNTAKNAVIALVLETRPYFAHPIKNMFVDPMQTVVWRCKAVARPPATYAWYKDGVPIQNLPGRIEARGIELTISSIEESDHGMYQCGATNAHGTTFTSGELKVLSFAPNFNRFPMKTSTMAPVGGTATLQCRVEGAPTPDVEWLKNEQGLGLLPGDLSGRIQMTLTYDLVLTEINYSDQGLYKCRATNPNGSASNTTYVTVVDNVVITQPPVPTDIIVNRTDFLYCTASNNAGNIDVVYEWKFNGHLLNLKHNTHLIKGVKDGMRGLYIREAQYSHNGVFTCVARTPLHADERSAMVNVRGPPSAPAGVYVDYVSVTSYIARVIWTKGQEIDHGAPVTSYDVEADSNYYPEQWTSVATDVQEGPAIEEARTGGGRDDQRSAVVKGLVPNTSYRFRVRAINEYGRGMKASKPSVYIKTPATIPYRAPDNVGGGDGKVGTLNISWTPIPDAEQCGPGIGYKVYWKMKTDNEKADWNKAVINGNGGMHTALVGIENYYLEYIVKVQAFNDIGDGANSTEVTIFSAMGLPNIVPTITSVSGLNISTVEVGWDMIPDDREHMNGRVLGYTIQYYWDDIGCNPMTNCEISNLRTRNIWGQTDSVMLIDLEMNSAFYFRLQVFNSAGRGPKGEWRYGETATYAPLNYPRFVTIESHGPHSVVVKWQGVMTTVNEEIITGYKVKWWEVQTDIRNASEALSDRLQTSVTVYGLQTKTVYQLRVQGVSAGGDGQMSNSIFFTVQGGRITIDPTTTEICYESRTCSSASRVSMTTLQMCCISIIAALVLFIGNLT